MSKSSYHHVTCTAPVNIAVVKYWGKRNADLILPINSSLSSTLSQNELCAKTTVAVSDNFTEDRMWLNGREQPISNKRLQNVLKEVRRLSSRKRSHDDDSTRALSGHVHICSENNFPTAAGLASSAAGYACLVFSLCKLFGVEGNISRIARIGSGSACRSLDGGFVAWRMGSEDDGSDSLAEQIVTHHHWPQLKVLILVVSAEKKLIGSTSGMETSVETSSLLKYRAESVVPDRMELMEQAIKDMDFPTFANLTMQDSNQFHATCLDTFPPIFYLNETSKKIIHLVHAYNIFKGVVKVAYTFDAGPNACLYLLEDTIDEFASIVKYYFPSSQSNGLEVKGCAVKEISTVDFVQEYCMEPLVDGLQYIISTEIGCGPRVLDDSEALLSDGGFPYTLS